MKRMLCSALAVGLITLGAYSLNQPGLAQDTAKDDLRYEVTASLSKFVDAANRADTKTIMAMISTKPEVTLLADGETYQGTADIQAHTERFLGQHGKYLCQLGTMSITNVHSLALATGPYTLRSRDGDNALAFHGAVTFVMEKVGHKRWVIVHLHRSTTAVKPQLD